jgi:hypothetical protein
VDEAAHQMESDLGDIWDRNGVLYQCPDKGGLGVKSTRALDQGAFFMEYSGDLITKQEAIQRDKMYGDQGKGCFLLYFKHRGEHLAVDATLSSRKGKYINHNKKGNLMLKVALETSSRPGSCWSLTGRWELVTPWSMIMGTGIKTLSLSLNG